MHPKTEEKLEDLYYEGIPGYIRDATRNYVVINSGSDWEGYSEHKITIEDVVRYYAHEAGNIVSGIRTLGGIVGDWRNIDAMANECLEIFKVLNIEKLRSESRKIGLEPKF